MDQMTVWIGLAGWHYADWRDTVYRLPSEGVQPDLFGNVVAPAPRYVADELVYVSQFVDMLEINSSFYRIPAPRAAASWASRVADRPGFFFTAKLNNEFTHRFRRDRPLMGEFRRAMEPLAERELLRGVLAQFRYDFADTAETRELLTWIAAEVKPVSDLIVEVRHNSWETPAALEFLADLGATVAMLDYPTANDSFNLRTVTIGGRAYLRLHGRNRQAWFSKEADVNETYNYDYSDEEIGEIGDRARELVGDVKELTIVANNHYQGKAVSAALRLKASLEDHKVAVPPALLEAYPNLKRIASGCA